LAKNKKIDEKKVWFGIGALGLIVNGMIAYAAYTQNAVLSLVGAVLGLITAGKVMFG